MVDKEIWKLYSKTFQDLFFRQYSDELIEVPAGLMSFASKDGEDQIRNEAIILMSQTINEA